MPVHGEPSGDERRRAAAHVLLDLGQEAALDSGVIPLSSDVEHHLERVLRLGDGAVVSVTDGSGRWRMASWRSATSDLESTGDVMIDERRAPLTLASSIPKGDRVDVLVQKATELGVGRIVLLHAERSVVRWKTDRATKQIVRLTRIADEAVRQSRRVWRVPIEGPFTAADVVEGAVLAEPGGGSLTGDEQMVAIGPEGGWSDTELELAAQTVSLGTGILRVETAAIAVCALRMTLGH